FPITISVDDPAGITKAIAQAFARHTTGNAHFDFVWHSLNSNKAAAEAVIASFPKPPSP
ncbi:hypothetical protein LXA43DRAFT_862374, partial [Ganoderma leucocontextum]